MMTLFFMIRKHLTDKNEEKKLGDYTREGIFLLIVELVFVPVAHHGSSVALKALGLVGKHGLM